MKRLFALLVIMFFISGMVFAEDTYIKKYAGYPQGTFKKTRSGQIVQYDKNGKKIGVYKPSVRKYKKIK